MSYPWYSVVEGDELQQGDILEACRVVHPLALPPMPDNPDDVPEVDADVFETPVVVMTQSCDLALRADGSCMATDVLLCPLLTFERMALEVDPKFEKARYKDEVRKGKHLRFHLLDESTIEHHEAPHRIVELDTYFTLPVGPFREFVASVGPRLRLNPPYREHLSQAFARTFMRVGLPSDIPPFT